MRLLLTLCLLLSFSSIHSGETSEERIQAVLEAYFPEIEYSEIVIEELKGGLSSSQNYKLVVNGKNFVLRLQDLSDSSDYLEQWLLTAHQAGQAGIGPKLYWIAPDSTAILMEYVVGEPLTTFNARHPENIKRIAASFKKLHALPIHLADFWPFIDELEYAFEQLQKYHLVNTDLEKAMVRARALNAELKRRNYPSKTVHGDLNARNIFLTPSGMRMVDWVETKQEDPFFDLAYFSISLDYTAVEEHLLLENYLGAPPNEEALSHYAIAKELNVIGFIMFLPEIAYDWSQAEGSVLDLDRPIKDWSCYLRFFADTREEITPQFFYDSGKSSLQRWLEQYCVEKVECKNANGRR